MPNYYTSRSVFEANPDYQKFKAFLKEGKTTEAISFVKNLNNDITLTWGYWILANEHKHNASWSEAAEKYENLGAIANQALKREGGIINKLLTALDAAGEAISNIKLSGDKSEIQHIELFTCWALGLQENLKIKDAAGWRTYPKVAALTTTIKAATKKNRQELFSPIYHGIRQFVTKNPSIGSLTTDDAIFALPLKQSQTFDQKQEVINPLTPIAEVKEIKSDTPDEKLLNLQEQILSLASSIQEKTRQHALLIAAPRSAIHTSLENIDALEKELKSLEAGKVISFNETLAKTAKLDTEEIQAWQQRELSTTQHTLGALALSARDFASHFKIGRLVGSVARSFSGTSIAGPKVNPDNVMQKLKQRVDEEQKAIQLHTLNKAISAEQELYYNLLLESSNLQKEIEREQQQKIAEQREEQIKRLIESAKEKNILISFDVEKTATMLGLDPVTYLSDFIDDRYRAQFKAQFKAERAAWKIAYIEKEESDLRQEPAVIARHKKDSLNTHARENDQRLVVALLVALIGSITGIAIAAWSGLTHFFGSVGAFLGLGITNSDFSKNNPPILTRDEQIQAAQRAKYAFTHRSDTSDKTIMNQFGMTDKEIAIAIIDSTAFQAPESKENQTASSSTRFASLSEPSVETSKPESLNPFKLM